MVILNCCHLFQDISDVVHIFHILSVSLSVYPSVYISFVTLNFPVQEINSSVIDLNDIALSHCFEFHFVLKSLISLQ